MSKYQRYRVAHLFTIDGVVMTNDHEEQIRALPRAVRDEQIRLGHLEEFEADQPPPVPLAEANATETKKETI